MNLKRTIASTVALAALAGWSATAFAENNAYCAVVSHGDKVKKATGHCNFQDSGSEVRISLVNGDSYTLRKLEKKNNFKDQKGKKVHRTIRDKDKAYYFKWESKNITVTPEVWKK